MSSKVNTDLYYEVWGKIISARRWVLVGSKGAAGEGLYLLLMCFKGLHGLAACGETTTDQESFSYI